MKRLVALVPPRGLHLTCLDGVFAPNASLRVEVMLPTTSRHTPAPGEAPPARKPKRVRLDWATALQRTFGIDVRTCHCGGRRTVRAIVAHRATAEAMLRNMGLAGAPTPQPASH